MVLIAKNYTILTVSQILSIVGAFLFVIALIIPSFRVFNYVDASIMCFISVLTMIIMLYFYVKSNLMAGGSQSAKISHFHTLIDMSTGYYILFEPFDYFS